MSDDNNATPALPVAGWYPDPHDAAAQRYWDGAQWTEHTSAPAAGAVTEAAAVPADTAAATMPIADAGRSAGDVPLAVTGGGAVAMSARPGRPRLKWWQWALIGVGALVLLSIIIGALNGGGGSADAPREEPVTVAEAEEVSPAKPEPVDTSVPVPDVRGATVADARAALEAAGFVLVIDPAAGEDWVIVSHSPGAREKADPGAEVSVVAEAPKPVYSLAQQNAIRKAQSYLDFSGFSRQGLIDQLEYEGFSADDATFGADHAGADWNAEAAEKAASYLEFTSFSRQGLYDQLAYEGFTDAEIQHGLAAVGY